MPAGVAGFWLVSFTLAMTPGADWAYAILAGLRHRTVVPAVGGLLFGHLAATVVVAAGVGVLLARSSLIMTGLTIAGAVYLVWLGVSTLVRPSTPHAGTDPAGGSWVRQAARGAGISGLNPKLFLLFLALMPQFIDPQSSWSVGDQILLLGLVHVATCAVIYAGVGSGARLVLATRPAAARVVTRISGVTMTVIGVILLLEQLIT